MSREFIPVRTETELFPSNEFTFWTPAKRISLYLHYRKHLKDFLYYGDAFVFGGDYDYDYNSAIAFTKIKGRTSGFQIYNSNWPKTNCFKVGQTQIILNIILGHFDKLQMLWKKSPLILNSVLGLLY